MNRGVAVAAVRGATWTIAGGVGSRAVGLLATLALTFYLSREMVGAVSDAAIVLLLANQLSTLGVGQYLIAAHVTDRRVAWHATVVHLGLGAIAIAGVASFAPSFGRWLHAPDLARYVPGLALAAMADRLAFIPSRLLARDMRFRAIAISRAAGELAYAALAVALAAAGIGAMAIVLANVGRSALRTALVVAAVDRADWLTPSRPSMAVLRALFRFGVPFSIGATAELFARRVDNLIVSSFFGAGVVGSYNLAYGLADVPAVQIGEQIGDVLLPSFAKMPERERPAALLRAVGLLSLVIFPLAVGLGVTASTVVDALLPPAWRDVAPLLAALSALSVTRPIGWVISGYLQAHGRARAVLLIEVANLAMVVGFLYAFGRGGPLWSCVAVGAAFLGHAMLSALAVREGGRVPLATLASRSARPLAACVPMAAAVIATRAIARAVPPSPRLGLEVVAGAIAYAVAAWVVARPLAADAIALVRRAFRRRAA